MSDDILRKLQLLYAESPVTKGFFLVLSRRKNETNVTKVDRMLELLSSEGVAATRQEIVEIMKRLGTLGVGRFLAGRHTKPSRFEWSTSALEVAKAATGEASNLDVTTPVIPANVEEIPDDDETLEHRFHLRPDFAVTIELPVNLSVREAERLAAFIQTLPIKPDSEA